MKRIFLAAVVAFGMSATCKASSPTLLNVWPPTYFVVKPPGGGVLLVLPIGGGPPLCIDKNPGEPPHCYVPYGAARGGGAPTVKPIPDVPERRRRPRR